MKDAVTYRIAIDVGGTFTDVVLWGSDGSMSIKKIASSIKGEEAMISAIREVLGRRGVNPAAISDLVHGATVGSNTVLEKTGAKAGFITTKGFSDLLELRRIRHPDIFDMAWKKPEPLIPRYLCREVDERMDAEGNIVRRLSRDEVRKVVHALVQEGVTSLAVCLLHSPMNPIHEQEIAQLVQEEFPDLFVSISFDTVRVVGEYERASTTVVNAYILPVMCRYVENLKREVVGIGVHAPLFIMQSTGGMMTSSVATVKPVFCLESGPVAGVLGGVALAKALGELQVITFDMGGTTSKVSIVEKQEPRRAWEYEVGEAVSVATRLLRGGGYVIKARCIDVAEVGAGGGSVAYVDRGGALHVGPRSAGAVPGPVCYNQGGEEPTISDANLILGYLNPEHLLSGEVKVNREKTLRIFADKVANPLGMSLEQAAYGVHIVANVNMARVVRGVSIERGRDARDFTLIAFGGSGPVHAVGVAQSLGIRKVVVPNTPGLFSSLGLLFVPVEHEFEHAVVREMMELYPEEWEGLFQEVESEALRIMEFEGVPTCEVALRRLVDVRYAGQFHELTIDVSSGPIAAEALRQWEGSFEQQHLQIYGYKSPGEPIEIVNLRVVARRSGDGVPFEQLAGSAGQAYKPSASRGSRIAYFGREYGSIDTPVISRMDLTKSLNGPLIIEEYDTTIVVLPGFKAKLDAMRNVIIENST